ncbi:hypothetical protein HN011_006310 [Eciton burchellii]|nr:hypothetical protein HN011_006310 [Eciton burchellii]
MASSSSMQSFNDTFTEEQKIALLTSIKMNLQAIKKATHDVKQKFKIIQEEMHVTNALINAIETNKSTANEN